MIAWLDQADSLLLGPFWFAGCVLLGGGALVAWVAKIPSWRVRISELALLGMAAWLILALVPMPRLGQAEPLGNASASITVVDLERMLDPAELALAIEQANAAPVLVLPEQAVVEAPAASMLPTISDVWLLAAAVSFVALLVGALLLWRLLSRTVKADASVQRLAQQVGARLGLKKAVDVRIHDKLRAPFCCQLRTVVLPKELLVDRNALRAVLAHELAHIVAADPLRRTLFALLTPLFILHPAWWLLRRMSTQASEEAADARAAMALGHVASQYARPLIELSARLGRNGVAPPHPSIVGVLGQPTSFTRRMTMLLTRDPAQAVRSLNRRQGVLATASTLLALALSVGAWGTPASAQDRAQGAAAAPMDQTIRPDFADCALRDALLIISRKTSLKIAIDTDVAARNIRIKRLALGEMPVRRLLDTLAVAHNLRWKMEKGRVVFRTAKAQTVPVEPPLLTEYRRGRPVVEELSKASRETAPIGSYLHDVVSNSISRDAHQALLQSVRAALKKIQEKSGPESATKKSMLQNAPEGAGYEALRALGLADRYVKQAKGLLKKGQLQAALNMCMRAQALQPDDGEALNLRDEVLRAMGDDAPAAHDYERTPQWTAKEAYENALRSVYWGDWSKHDKSLRKHWVDSAGRAYDDALNKLVEPALPDALRKANPRSRESKVSDSDRKAMKKAFPEMAEKQRESLLDYYRKLGERMPLRGGLQPQPSERSKALPTVVYPVRKSAVDPAELVLPAGAQQALQDHYQRVIESRSPATPYEAAVQIPAWSTNALKQIEESQVKQWQEAVKKQMLDGVLPGMVVPGAKLPGGKLRSKKPSIRLLGEALPLEGKANSVTVGKPGRIKAFE